MIGNIRPYISSEIFASYRRQYRICKHETSEYEASTFKYSLSHRAALTLLMTPRRREKRLHQDTFSLMASHVAQNCREVITHQLACKMIDGCRAVIGPSSWPEYRCRFVMAIVISTCRRDV